MSQVTNTTTGIINTNNGNTPWNRTPGKPGVGSGNTAGTHSAFSSAPSAVPWSTTNRGDIDLIQERDQIEDSVDKKTQSIRSLVSYANSKNSDNSSTNTNTAAAVANTTATGNTGQMWPPPVFDSPRLTDRNVGGFLSQESSSSTDNQWATTTPFSGQTASAAAVGAAGNTNSLLGSPNSFPNIINHTQTINPNLWSFDNSNNCPSAPRAITGQQLNVTLATTSPPPSETTSSEHTRRYMNWTLGSDQDLLNDDRSGLAFPLSNININNNNNNSIGGFGNQSDFIENQSSFSSPMNANIRNSSNKISEFDVGQSNISKKSNSDIDTSTCDTEEAIRTAVNTTEPWGIHPVDQSTPWNCSEANGDCLPMHSSASTTGTPGNNDLSTSASRVTGLNQSSGGGVSNIQPSGTVTTTATAATIATQSSLHSRRLSSANSSSAVVSRDLESNIWPSEPPNGTGIWESHYESLGERTARWHQSTNSGQPPPTTPLQPPPLTSQASFASHSLNPANFVSSQMSQHPSHRSRPQQGQIPSNTESFRGINRGPVVPGTIFPLGQPPTPNVMNLGTRPLFGGNHSLGQINSNVGGNTGPSRGFPLAAPVNLGPGVSWPYSPATHPGDPAVPGINFGNKSRWPGPNMNRLPVGGKQQQQQQQQHPPTHILPNMTSTGLRWPPGGTTPQMQGVWPLTTDQRRPGTVQGPQWSSASTSGMDNNPSGYFNQPNQSLPPRVSQQISAPEFPTSLAAAAAASSRGVNQAFRTPQSAFYPAMTPGFTSSSMSQRMFMSPQQHSQQLQQQSVIRAHVMRQLFSLGFSEDEIQPIFADTNTSVERALIDLRDRSGHPGIDELINSLKPITASLLTSLNPDDGSLSCLGQNSTPSNRLMMAMRGNDLSKSTLPMHSQPAENLELSLQLLQQRESQILQTIVQLQSKHQELNQKLSHIRSANVPFATNPVMQELQLQTFQVAQQIDAQQAQLKHVRSQAAMLKQINLPPNLLSSSSSNPSSSSSLHGGMTATTTPLLPPLSMSGMPGQSSSSSLHGMSPLPLNSTGNCNSLNLLTTSNNNNTNSSWSLQSGSNLGGKSNHQLLNNSGNNNNNNNNMTSGVTENHPDFSQDQSNFNMMNSLLWESSPWSGSSSQQHLSENFSTANRNHISSDRRWPLPPGAGSGVTGNGNSSSIISSSSSSANRSPFISSQLASLGDPRWTDIANDMSNSTGNDTRQQQSLVGGEIDELRNCGSGIDYPLIPMSISSKSWLLAHNIPPHVSVGMLKATVSTALSNHLMKSSESHDKSGDSRNNNNNNNGEPEFEIHPNMSARWILLGLCNSLQASVVHKSLENANNSQLNGYYGSVKLITPAEALLHLQDIQSLASRLKGLSTDNCLSSASSNLHSINQSSSILTGCDFNSSNNNINNSNNLNNDISGSNYSMIGSNTANNNNSNTSDI